MYMKKKLEDYQLRELETGQLYINKYSLDLKYIYELNTYWKEFFFDILSELSKKGRTVTIVGHSTDSLLDFFKKEYYNIIKDNKLKIDKRLYVEIEDYISFKDWSSESGHGIAYTKDGAYLIQL